MMQPNGSPLGAPGELQKEASCNALTLMKSVSKLRRSSTRFALCAKDEPPAPCENVISPTSRRKRSQVDNTDLRTLRRRLQQSELQSGTDVQRSAFELKNKITGLMMAVKLEDGDVSSRSSSSSQGSPGEGRPTSERRKSRVPKRAGGSKRIFGGGRVQLSLRTKLVDAHRAIPAEMEAAALYRKKLSDDKRHWRQVTHRFGVQVHKDSEDEDEADEHEQQQQQQEDDDSKDERMPRNTAQPRRKSIAHQDSVRGKAQMLLIRAGATPPPEEDDADDWDDDGMGASSLTGHKMPLRTKEAIFGSEAAFDQAAEDDSARRRAEIRDRRRSMSVTDLKLLQRKASMTLPSSELWAKDDDVSELFTEYISCVRKDNKDWKLRFLPPPSPPRTGTGRVHFSRSGGGESAAGGSEQLEEPPLGPHSQLVVTLPALPTDTSAARRQPAPKHVQHHTVKLPAVDSGVVSRLVTQLVDAAGAANHVVTGAHPPPGSAAFRSSLPFQTTERKYRCPHCCLRPAAVDNQSLLSKLHVFAAAGAAAPPPTHHSPLASRSITCSSADAQATLGALNTDTSLYTGVLSEGAIWGVTPAVWEQLSPDITVQSLQDLDKLMWREVAAHTLKQDPMSSDEVLVDAGTALHHQCVAHLQSVMKSFLATDSNWMRQTEVIQLSRERDIRSLRRSLEEEKRKYNAHLSHLRSIQLDCDASEKELSALRHRGDVATMVRAQQDLMKVEKEIEDTTVSLCDVEFRRREIKKNLAKVAWTADSMHHANSKLVELRGAVYAMIQEFKSSLSPAHERRMRELDVGRPIEDADAARSIYARCTIPETGRRSSLGGSAANKPSGAARLRRFVSTKVQSRKTINASSLMDAVVNAQQIDYITDDVLADVDEVLRGAAMVAAPAHSGGLQACASGVFAAAPSGSFQDRVPELEASIHRLLGSRCPQCDQFQGSTKYCPQTGALHASQDATHRPVLETPSAPIEASAAHVGTFYRICWSNSDLAEAGGASSKSGLVRGAEAAPATKTETSGSSTRPRRDTTELSKKSSTVSSSQPIKQSVASYVDKKRAKEAMAAVRRRSSVMLARLGNDTWMVEAQRNSSDSDSEIEYADADHDSEEEDVEERRRSVAAVFNEGDDHIGSSNVAESDAVRAAARRRSFAIASAVLPGNSDVEAEKKPMSTLRRQTLTSFKFGAEETSVSAVDEREQPALDDEAEGDDDPVDLIVTRRRQSAVKDRISKRKKFKEAAFRTKLKLAVAVGAFQEGISAGGDVEGPDPHRRFTDMATVNLLTILTQEMKWRMTASTSEPLPGTGSMGLAQVGSAALFSSAETPPAPSLPTPPSSSSGTPPPLLSHSASLDVFEGGVLLKKLLKSTHNAKTYDGLKPPTTALTGAHGSAAVALATVSGAAAVAASGGTTFYPLWYPHISERRLALQSAEIAWMQQLAPMLAKVSDIVMARSAKLHGSLSTPSRRAPVSSSNAKPLPCQPSPPPAHRGGQTPKKKVTSSGRKPVVIPSFLNPTDLQAVASQSLASASTPPRSTRGGNASPRTPAASNSELQLTEHIEQLKEVVKLAYQPTRQALQRLMTLERQAEELTKQLKTAQERRAKESAEGGVEAGRQ